MLYCRLERIGAAKLRVDHDQTDCPVHDDREPDKQDGACEKTSIPEGVGLSNDAGATAPVSTHWSITCPDPPHMMLFAMFMNELRMPLLGFALSR
jgi:hypothetical protein